MNSTNTKVFALISVGLGLVLAGCEGTGPSTQTGAVTGGVLGAIAGGIIGNNNGHNALGGALVGGAIGAIAGGTIGNSIDHANGTIYGSQGAATTTVVVQQPPPPPPPPPPQAEYVPPQPTPDAVWITGHWEFDGPSARYVWIRGCWVVPPGYGEYWVRPHWAYRDGGYVYIRGYWR